MVIINNGVYKDQIRSFIHSTQQLLTSSLPFSVPQKERRIRIRNADIADT